MSSELSFDAIIFEKRLSPRKLPKAGLLSPVVLRGAWLPLNKLPKAPICPIGENVALCGVVLHGDEGPFGPALRGFVALRLAILEKLFFGS